MKRGGSRTHLDLVKGGLATIVLCGAAALFLLSHDAGSAAYKMAMSGVPAGTGMDARLIENPNAEGAAPATAPAKKKASSSSAPGARSRVAIGGQGVASASATISLPLPTQREVERQARPLWSVDPSRSNRTGFPREDLVDVAYPVDLDPAGVASLLVGDRTTLAIPGLGEFDALVEYMSMATNGDLTWIGHLVDVEGSYSVIFTQGEELTFATIQTPDGTYLLEGQGENTWIFRDDLDELIDTAQTDELIPTETP